MNIFHLDEAAIWGGAENQLNILHRGLLEQGVDSLILGRPNSPLHERLKDRPDRFHSFRPRFEVDMMAAIGLVRLIRREEPDIVHAHTSRSHAIARLAQLVHPEFNLVVSRRVNYPLRRNGFSRLKYRFGVSRYIAVCEAVKKTLVAGGVAAERISVVHSCAANVGHARTRTRQGDSFVVGFAGRLEANKRPLDAIDAVARLRNEGANVSLLVAGDGHLRDEISTAVRERGIQDAVTLLGHQMNLDQFFEKIDVLAFCSVGGEGLPNVVLEAMAAGVPVVASRVDGIPEVVEDGLTGLLIDPGDVTGLTSSLKRASTDLRLREILVRSASERIRRDFAPESLIEATLAVYVQAGV